MMDLDIGDNKIEPTTISEWFSPSEEKANLEHEEVKPVINWMSVNWNCYYCPETFENFKLLRAHFQMQHNIINEEDIHYPCSVCDDIFFSYASFVSHVRSVHHDALKLCCDACSANFSNYEELSKHRHLHIEDVGDIHPNIYYCTMCEGVQSNENDLKFHVENSHNSNETPIVDGDDVSSESIKLEKSEEDCDAETTLPPLTKRSKVIQIERNASSSELFSENVFLKKHFKVLAKLIATEQQRQDVIALVQCHSCKCILKASLRSNTAFIKHLRLQHAYKYSKNMESSNSKSSASPVIQIKRSACAWDIFSDCVLFKKYFTIISKRKETEQERQDLFAVVMCRACKCFLKGSLRLTSAFIKHLEVQHAYAYQQYVKEIGSPSLRNQICMPKKYCPTRKTKDFNRTYNTLVVLLELECINDNIDPEQFWKTPNHVRSNLGNVNAIETTISRTKRTNFDKLILNFIIDNMLDVSIVEEESFKKLMRHSHPSLTLIDKATLKQQIDEQFASKHNDIKNLLKNQEYMCTTANLWSSTTSNEKLFAYTCHWLNEDFKMQSVALAFKRFRANNFNKIFIHIIVNNIHTEYGLNKKNLVAIIINNDLHYEHGFKEIGLNLEFDDDEDFHDDILKENDIELPKDLYPKQIRCAVHDLVLVASTDFVRIIKENISTYIQHKMAMQKCCALWNKQKQSKYVENRLKCPNVARWNSLYDSINDILLNKNELETLCTTLAAPVFEHKDIQYLEDFIVVMEPLMEAIKILQENGQALYAYIFPTLATIRIKYLKIIENSRKEVLRKLAKSLLSAIEKRFENYFHLTEEANEAIVGAVLCPFLNLQWIKALNENSTEIISVVCKLFAEESRKDYVRRVLGSALASEETFDINAAHDLEICAYLTNSSKSINQLHRCDFVKKLYKKHNTPLPSFAVVEKLFSFETLTKVFESDLNNRTLEKVLLLKTNNSIHCK